MILKTIGNIFLVNRNINWESVLISIVILFLSALFPNLVLNRGFGSSFISWIKGLFGVPFALAVGQILNKFGVYKRNFKYFENMSLYFLITLVFELFLALAIFYFIPNIYGYIFGGLFLISGIFRAFIQKSRALFFSDIEDFIEINRGYGYFRVSAFVSVLAVFLWELGGNLGSFSLFSISVYLFILFFYILWISNLYPYCTKQEDLKNTIVILRHIAETDGIKLNKIARKEGFSKEFTNKQADNLEEANFIKIFNKRGHLEKTYEEIYNLGDRL